MTETKKNHIDSTDELLNRRSEVNSMTDSQIEDELRREWMEYDKGDGAVDEDLLSLIKSRIDREVVAVTPQPTKRYSLKRWLQIAAAILLPIFIASTTWLYIKGTDAGTSTELLSISTGNGERASITLPDGTRVTLNANSKLEYPANDYNRLERRVRFSGEGYFDVAPNKDIPYIIDARGMEVTVLGTKFNLSNRESCNRSKLALEEGSVRLISTLKGNSVLLKPGEKATLWKDTGVMKVMGEKQIENASAWRQGELIFRNTRLSYVLKTIENNYGVKLDPSNTLNKEELFTGTMPAGNLNEVLDILEYSFHAKSSIYGDAVYFEFLK